MSGPALHHLLIKAPESVSQTPPDRYMLCLHGIFGMGRNWATYAGMLTRSNPRWGVILVDLRLHGRSTGFAPPHTLEACADDVQRLVASLGLPVRGIMGHSFGGKVAMVYARSHGKPLDQIWVLDSTPEAFRSATSPLDVLNAMRRVPMPQPSRTAVVQALKAQGQPEDIAQWLSTNVEVSAKKLNGEDSGDSGYRWRFDFDGLEALMMDFYQTDLWEVVENPPFGAQLHLVKAERSDVLSAAGEARALEASLHGQTYLHILPNSGHWLHVDNPLGLLSVMEMFL